MARMTALEKATGTSYAAEKDRIYKLLKAHVESVTGRPFAKTQARKAFDLMVEEVMASAIRVGAFRFNDGHGVLKLHTYQGYNKVLPDGTMAFVTPSPKLKLASGRRTKVLLSTGVEELKMVQDEIFD